MTQEKRVHLALLKGDRIDWKWGASQIPYIADAPRKCRALLSKGFAVKKETIKTKSSSYMIYYYELKSI